jgi:hypothetical protein
MYEYLPQEGEDSHLLPNLAFLTDLTTGQNKTHIELQGKNKLHQ